MIANAGGIPIEANDIQTPVSLIISNAAILNLLNECCGKPGIDLIMEYKPDSDNVALQKF